MPTCTHERYRPVLNRAEREDLAADVLRDYGTHDNAVEECRRRLGQMGDKPHLREYRRWREIYAELKAQQLRAVDDAKYAAEQAEEERRDKRTVLACKLLRSVGMGEEADFIEDHTDFPNLLKLAVKVVDSWAADAAAREAWSEMNMHAADAARLAEFQKTVK